MATKYKFKGYTIKCCGYHQPDHCVWWEAVDDSGNACFHGETLREVEFMILDSEWEEKIRAKEREVAELRKCLKEAVHAVCYDCDEQDENGCSECRMKCAVNKWRKALEGAEDGK